MMRMSISVLLACLVVCGAPSAQTARAPTTQSAEEIIIKEKLNVAGVTEVKELTRNRDGSWNGRAIKDNVEVAVVVDTDGNVIFH
jgi:hypothetical protein